MPKKSAESTRERILRAAERIYAASGFHGMSLRDVTLLAGVNLAALSLRDGKHHEVFKALRQGRNTRAITVRLVAQMMIDDPRRFAQIHKTFYKPVLDCYHGELQRTIPRLTSHQVNARFFCAFATVLGVRLMHESMDWFLKIRAEDRQFDILEREMHAFLQGAFAAPSE